jgi:hypothetical protein
VCFLLLVVFHISSSWVRLASWSTWRFLCLGFVYWWRKWFSSILRSFLFIFLSTDWCVFGDYSTIRGRGQGCKHLVSGPQLSRSHVWHVQEDQRYVIFLHQ